MGIGPFVVAIDVAEVTTTRVAQVVEQVVSASRPTIDMDHTAAIVQKEPDAIGVFRRIALRDPAGTIGAAILAKEDLVGERTFLHEDAIDACSEVWRVLVRGNGNGDQWILHSSYPDQTMNLASGPLPIRCSTASMMAAGSLPCHPVSAR